MSWLANPFVTVLLAMVLALLIDAVIGEPRRFHPLVGFGGLTKLVEQHHYRQSRVAGCFAVLVLLLPFAVAAVAISYLLFGSRLLVFNVLVLYLVIGRKSLVQHAMAVYAPLASGELGAARRKIGYMVSRDTSKLEAPEITSATVESVLENGNDAVFGALFWFVVAGAPGAVLYRLSNTLDAMWGYKSDRYLKFGWAAARLDDVLNFIPARLTVLAYGLAGRPLAALRCYWRQGRHWKSPNAGPVMAAGAGSLGVQLGGSAIYSGQREYRPVLGEGNKPAASDIAAAVRLVNRSVMIWLAAIALGISVAMLV